MYALIQLLEFDVHDVADYGSNCDRLLETGMLLSVELELYIVPDVNMPEVIEELVFLLKIRFLSLKKVMKTWW
ncbi:MAG: hypothetical protein ACTS73_05655 [Arsenophonus sp. NEOnobi-MAG3]